MRWAADALPRKRGDDDLTYCLAIKVADGLLLASDSRSNAGVDNVVQVSKLAVFAVPGERVIAVQSAGNLATTQAVVTRLRQGLGSGDAAEDLRLAATLFDVAALVGARLREVVAANGPFVQPYGDAGAGFLVSGQIAGSDHGLFEVYAAGNFIEATERACFLQIGEAKYGKPILDRALEPTNSLDEAEKLALLSFDATLRSNLSVGLPIDILRYRAGSLEAAPVVTIDDDTPYWSELRRLYSEGLNSLVAGLPSPPAAWSA